MRPAHPTVAAFVRACAAGDAKAARAFLSPDFGLQDGRDAESWLRHEVAEYARRATAFGLTGAPAVAAVPGLEGVETFAVLSDAGALVFEDAVGIDGAGRLRGNGRRYEAVSKVAFRMGRPPARAIALRSPEGRIETMRVEGETPLEARFGDGMTYVADGFHSFEATLEGDDLRGRPMAFRIVRRGPAGLAVDRLVMWMRGTDDPFYDGEKYPAVDGDAVALPGSRSAYWTLTAMSSAGPGAETRTVEHPAPGATFRFGWPVALAVLTDALDNDWYAWEGPP